MPRETYSTQYNTPCVIAEDGDDEDDIIEFADDIGAHYWEGPEPEDKLYVVTLRPDVGPECWTERAIRRSRPGVRAGSAEKADG